MLDSKPIILASVALAVVESQGSKTVLPQSAELSAVQKRTLALQLSDRDHLNGANISRLIGVTRQAVYSYLKKDEEVEHG